MKKILKIAGIILLLLLVVFLAIPRNHYIIKALIYQKVNIDDYRIFENRTVTAELGEDWSLDSNYNKQTIDSGLRKAFERYNTVAYLVIKDSMILHEEYWDDYNDSSLSNSFSVAKSIISLLIGIAIDEGKIGSVDEPVCKYLPEFCSKGNNILTIRHLLTMSSGLNWDESYSSLFSMTTKSYYGKNIRQQVLSLKVVEKPGVSFKYLSCNTQLLALILEKATGKQVSEYASEKLWKPLGAMHDAQWCLDEKDGVEKAYCCFNTNARDFARFGQLILNKGEWHGKQIISEKYLDEATTPATYLKDEDGSVLKKYGFQWWMMEYENQKVIYARGVNGQYIMVIPSKNMVVVRLGHHRSKELAGGHPKDMQDWLKIAFSLD